MISLDKQPPFSALGGPASGWQGGALDHYANSPGTSYKVYKVYKVKSL